MRDKIFQKYTAVFRSVPLWMGKQKGWKNNSKNNSLTCIEYDLKKLTKKHTKLFFFTIIRKETTSEF